MRHGKCKCGKVEYFGSGMTPQDCEGCEECGTNFSQEPIKPHTLEIRYSERTGKPKHNICIKCHHTEALES